MAFDVHNQTLLLALQQDSIAVDVSLCIDPEDNPPPFLRDLRTLVMVSGYLEQVPVSPASLEYI